jgi:hypothetical protein
MYHFVVTSYATFMPLFNILLAYICSLPNSHAMSTVQTDSTYCAQQDSIAICLHLLIDKQLQTDRVRASRCEASHQGSNPGVNSVWIFF